MPVGAADISPVPGGRVAVANAHFRCLRFAKVGRRRVVDFHKTGVHRQRKNPGRAGRAKRAVNLRRPANKSGVGEKVVGDAGDLRLVKMAGRNRRGDQLQSLRLRRRVPRRRVQIGQRRGVLPAHLVSGHRNPGGRRVPGKSQFAGAGRCAQICRQLRQGDVRRLQRLARNLRGIFQKKIADAGDLHRVKNRIGNSGDGVRDILHQNRSAPTRAGARGFVGAGFPAQLIGGDASAAGRRVPAHLQFVAALRRAQVSRRIDRGAGAGGDPERSRRNHAGAVRVHAGDLHFIARPGFQPALAVRARACVGNVGVGVCALPDFAVLHFPAGGRRPVLVWSPFHRESAGRRDDAARRRDARRSGGNGSLRRPGDRGFAVAVCDLYDPTIAVGKSAVGVGRRANVSAACAMPPSTKIVRGGAAHGIGAGIHLARHAGGVVGIAVYVVAHPAEAKEGFRRRRNAQIGRRRIVDFLKVAGVGRQRKNPRRAGRAQRTFHLRHPADKSGVDEKVVGDAGHLRLVKIPGGDAGDGVGAIGHLHRRVPVGRRQIRKAGGYFSPAHLISGNSAAARRVPGERHCLRGSVVGCGQICRMSRKSRRTFQRLPANTRRIGGQKRVNAGDLRRVIMRLGNAGNGVGARVHHLHRVAPTRGGARGRIGAALPAHAVCGDRPAARRRVPRQLQFVVAQRHRAEICRRLHPLAGAGGNAQRSRRKHAGAI